MWGAIQYVSSALTLVAFIAAVVAFLYTRKISSTERLIRTANKDDRAKLVTEALEVFSIDASKLTKDQQYEIANEQIKNRLTRSKIGASVTVFIALLCAVVLIYTVSKSGNAVDSEIENPNQSKTLYSASGPFHLGDEKLAGWPPVYSTPCFNAEFHLSKPLNTLTIKLETYGAEVNNPILLNNEEVAVLPPQGANHYGSIRPNEWSDERSISIPADKAVIGRNTVSLCVGLVTHPEFEGDKDDFQFRNLRLIAK